MQRTVTCHLALAFRGGFFFENRRRLAGGALQCAERIRLEPRKASGEELAQKLSRTTDAAMLVAGRIDVVDVDTAGRPHPLPRPQSESGDLAGMRSIFGGASPTFLADLNLDARRLLWIATLDRNGTLQGVGISSSAGLRHRSFPPARPSRRSSSAP